jgi:hypothetical protein
MRVKSNGLCFIGILASEIIIMQIKIKTIGILTIFKIYTSL